MKRLLIVVDYQKDFVDGSLGFDGAEKLDARIAEKIASYRATGDEVAFTFDTHHRDYLKTQEGRVRHDDRPCVEMPDVRFGWLCRRARRAGGGAARGIAARVRACNRPSALASATASALATVRLRSHLQPRPRLRPHPRPQSHPCRYPVPVPMPGRIGRWRANRTPSRNCRVMRIAACYACALLQGNSCLSVGYYLRVNNSGLMESERRGCKCDETAADRR